MFLGFVDDSGYFAFDRSPQWKLFCEKHKGHEVLLIAKRKPARQGSQAMRYYRGVVIPDLARACHLDGDEEDLRNTHEGMAWKYLRIADGPFGNPRRRSTKKDDLSQAEMAEYIDKVIRWAETSLENCHIRRPHEVEDWDTVQDYWEAS